MRLFWEMQEIRDCFVCLLACGDRRLGSGLGWARTGWLLVCGFCLLGFFASSEGLL